MILGINKLTYNKIKVDNVYQMTKLQAPLGIYYILYYI